MSAWKGVTTISGRQQEAIRKWNLLKGLMDERNISLKELSEKTGIDYSTFSHWKSGQYVPKTDKMIRICDVLDVSLKYFYE